MYRERDTVIVIYIYIEREGKGEREREMYMYMYMCMYMEYVDGSPPSPTRPGSPLPPAHLPYKVVI